MASTETWTRAQREVLAASFLGWMLDAFDFFLVVFVLDRLAIDFDTSRKSVTYALLLDPGDAAAWSFFVRAPCRSIWPAPSADQQCAAVCGDGDGLSVRAVSVDIPVSACALRRCHGRRVGRRGFSGIRERADQIARTRIGHSPGRLPRRLSAGSRRIRAAVRAHRLARHVSDRRGAGAATGALYLLSSARVGHLDRQPHPPTGAQPRCARPVGEPSGALGTRPLRGRADDRFQFLQPRHAGPVSRIPQVSTRLFPPGTISIIAIIYNIGAISGTLVFGGLSSRHRAAPARSALAALLALLALPFWAFSTGATTVAIAAFAMQFMVQGAWGVVPVHLNELSPDAIRGTFPGVVYQLGNLVASYNAPLQQTIADSHGGPAHPDYAFALTWVCGIVAVVLAVLALSGPERRAVRFGVQ